MSVKLPEGIDYSKYYSNSGMSTKHWGPALWKGLFTSIMGHYPVKVESEDDLQIKKSFKNLLCSLQTIMPCIFCRNSFKGFLKELPIEPYLIGRIELMYWLYQMKDKVNQKLLYQENICYNDEKKRLKALFYLKQISESDYYLKVNEFKKETFDTISTPSFEEVLEQYESLRAVCSKKAKKCSLPLKKS